MPISLLVEVADGTRRNLGAPEWFGDVLDTANRDTCQVHLDQSFFYAALAATVALDDGCLERDPLEFRHLQRDIA